MIEQHAIAIETLTQRFQAFTDDQRQTIQELTSWQHRQDDVIEELTLRMNAQDEVIANQAETIRNQSVVIQDQSHEIEQLRSVSGNLTQQVRALQCVENERLPASSDSIISGMWELGTWICLTASYKHCVSLEVTLLCDKTDKMS